jgi:hypothetical protein
MWEFLSVSKPLAARRLEACRRSSKKIERRLKNCGESYLMGFRED